MNTKKLKKLLILNVPYILVGLLATNVGEAWGALYPWTASVLLLQGRVEGTGYPVWLSITILIFVSGIGFMLTFLHFKKEDLK